MPRTGSSLFELGATFVSQDAYSLLVQAGIQPADLLEQHGRLWPERAQPFDPVARLYAIASKEEVLTRFLVLQTHPAFLIATVCVLTESGHARTHVLLAHEA